MKNEEKEEKKNIASFSLNFVYTQIINLYWPILIKADILFWIRTHFFFAPISLSLAKMKIIMFLLYIQNNKRNNIIRIKIDYRYFYRVYTSDVINVNFIYIDSSLLFKYWVFSIYVVAPNFIRNSLQFYFISFEYFTNLFSIFAFHTI